MNTFSPLLIVAAAKIRSDAAEEKAGVMPPPDAGGVLPNIPLMPMGPAFQVGALVRDTLSSLSGVVVEGPQGDFGDIVFVKFDVDGQTHPMNSKQLEAVNPPPMAAPMPPMAPVPELPPPPPEEKPEEKPKAEAKASLRHDFVASDPDDARNITYGQLVAKAKPSITAAKLLAEFGYVPGSWDRVLAALAAEGAIILRSPERPDVRALMDKGMAPNEIIYDACAACGPVFRDTVRRISAVRANLAIANRIKAAKGGAPGARPFPRG
jgi:hypothetical protein